MGELYQIRTDLYEGKLNAARVQLAAGIKKDQGSSEKGIQVFRRNLLGRTSLLLGNPAEARKQADAIMATRSNDLQAEDVLAAGVLYARAGDSLHARNSLRQLNSIQSQTSTKLNKSNVMKLTGEIALAEARNSDAIESFTAAGAEFPDGSAHMGIAKAFEAQRDWERAAHEWEQAVKARGEIVAGNGVPSDYPIAQFHLANCYRESGNTTAARQHYQEFLNLWGQTDDLPLRTEAADELRKLSLKK
jgi:tetratricopeptide (TPR) repeat protein